MNRLYALCQISGMRFNLLAVPADDPDKRPNLLNLDPAQTQRMFEVGYQLTSTGPAWRRTPPGAEPGEEVVPRGALPGCSYR